MATVKLTYDAKKFMSFYLCETVGLCLDSSWADLTVSGLPYVLAKIANPGRITDSMGNEQPKFIYPRPDGIYQFNLSYDDVQITDPVTNVIACCDINSIVDPCVMANVTGIVTQQTPWVEGTGVTYLQTITDLVGIGTNAPLADLDLVGGFTGSVLPIVADHLATVEDRVIVADATGGNVVVSLPPAASAFSASGTGLILTIKRDADDVSINTVTIDADGTETIDGTDVPISLASGEFRVIISDGTKWHVIGS